MTTRQSRAAITAPAAGLPLVALLLLWLSGICLRVTLLAVPPVIPLLHADLKLTESGIGALVGLPAFLFALAAVPGALLIARIGALRTLLAGLLLAAVASAARGAAGGAALLFATTLIMSLGIAVMQPALPPIVRDWLPLRIGFGTAVYANGLLVGEILAASLTIPVVLPLVGGSWRLSFLVWSLPMLATALLVALFAPRTRDGAHSAAPMRLRWWPEWRDPRIWRLGLMMGAVNSIYLASNGFLPDYLQASGRAELINAGLTALNLGQLPSSFLLLAIADRVIGRAWPLSGVGLLCLASTLGIMLAPGGWVVAAAGALGFSVACGLVLTLALPVLMSAPDDVHRTSAGMFTISYGCPVAISMAGGWLWDASGVPVLAFAPIALCALTAAVLAFMLKLGRHPAADGA